MAFNIIHPYIIDLYINALDLHLLQEKLCEKGPDGLTDEIKNDVDDATSAFVLSAKKAEDFFGSAEVVQIQLNAFSITQGVA